MHLFWDWRHCKLTWVIQKLFWLSDKCNPQSLQNMRSLKGLMLLPLLMIILRFVSGREGGFERFQRFFRLQINYTLNSFDSLDIFWKEKAIETYVVEICERKLIWEAKEKTLRLRHSHRQEFKFLLFIYNQQQFASHKLENVILNDMIFDVKKNLPFV